MGNRAGHRRGPVAGIRRAVEIRHLRLIPTVGQANFSSKLLFLDTPSDLTGARRNVERSRMPPPLLRDAPGHFEEPGSARPFLWNTNRPSFQQRRSLGG